MKTLINSSLLLLCLSSCGNPLEKEKTKKIQPMIIDGCAGGMEIKITLKNPVPSKIKIILQGKVIKDECISNDPDSFYHWVRKEENIISYRHFDVGLGTSDKLDLKIIDLNDCTAEKEIIRLEDHPLQVAPDKIDPAGPYYTCGYSKLDLTE